MPELTFFSFLTITTISYIACSAFFLKYPNLIHRKKIYKSNLLQKALNTDKILHISHRGGKIKFQL